MLPCPGNLRVRFLSLFLSALLPLTVTEARSFLSLWKHVFFRNSPHWLWPTPSRSPPSSSGMSPCVCFTSVLQLAVEVRLQEDRGLAF